MGWMDTISAALLVLLLVHVMWATIGAAVIGWAKAR